MVDHISLQEFVINGRQMQDDEFLGDTMQLLRPDDEFNPQEGYEVVRTLLLDRLQSDESPFSFIGEMGFTGFYLQVYAPSMNGLISRRMIHPVAR